VINTTRGGPLNFTELPESYVPTALETYCIYNAELFRGQYLINMFGIILDNTSIIE